MERRKKVLVLEVHRIEGGGAKKSVSFISFVSHRSSDGTVSFPAHYIHYELGNHPLWLSAIWSLLMMTQQAWQALIVQPIFRHGRQ